MIYSTLGRAFCQRYHIRSFTPAGGGTMIQFTHNRRANHALITATGKIFTVEFWKVTRYTKRKVAALSAPDLKSALTLFRDKQERLL